MLKSLLLLIILMNCSVSSAMKSLSTHADKELSKMRTNDVFVFFQSNCSACHALIKDLSCLDKKYNVKLLGSISPIKELKKEYKKYKVTYPAYFADPITMAELPINIPATPQVILWGKKPKLFLGLKPCKEYLKLLNNH